MTDEKLVPLDEVALHTHLKDKFIKYTPAWTLIDADKDLLIRLIVRDICKVFGRRRVQGG